MASPFGAHAEVMRPASLLLYTVGLSTLTWPVPASLVYIPCLCDGTSIPAGDVGRGLPTTSGQKQRKIDTNSVPDEDVETLPGTAPAFAGVSAGTLT